MGTTFVDSDGNEYSEEEAAQLIEEYGYYLVDEEVPGSNATDWEPYTPDTLGEYGVRDRDLWPQDQTERAATRYAAFKTMLDERNANG
jgi:hypothetical protein